MLLICQVLVLELAVENSMFIVRQEGESTTDWGSLKKWRNKYDYQLKLINC